jgi:Tol biopolymer transport system component
MSLKEMRARANRWLVRKTGAIFVYMTRARIVAVLAILTVISPLVAIHHWQASAEDTQWKIKKIAFEAFRRDLEGVHTDLYIVDGENAKPKRLAEGTSPSWSPDGRKLAYCIKDPNGQLQIMVADGNAKRQITDLKEGACSPVWSPDSKNIAFTSNRGKSGMIWVAAADGANPKAVLEGDVTGWSPDGTKLLFRRKGEKSREDGWIANADGSSPQLVFKDSSTIIGMAWFPDGKSVVYSSERPGGKSAVFRVDVDGSHTETFGAGNYQSTFSPVLSPDGKWLVVDAIEKSDAPKFTLIDAGGKLRKEWFYGRHTSVVWEKPKPRQDPSPSL